MKEDDEFSKMMPGSRDHVSIARNVHKQKRLLLCNLKELHCAYKEKYPHHKIGLSNFVGCVLSALNKCVYRVGTRNTFIAFENSSTTVKEQVYKMYTFNLRKCIRKTTCEHK